MTEHRDPSPSEFYAAFVKVVATRGSALLESWPSNTRHTSVMCNDVIPETARQLGLQHRAEYYQIDAVFYHERDEVNFRDPAWTYAKYISVAVEHENECYGSAVEMNRLQLYNAPLTVLVTYPTRQKTAETLEKYSAIVRAGDILENASTQRRQLVIFGYAAAEWEAFVYRDGGFVPLVLAAGQSTAL